MRLALAILLLAAAGCGGGEELSQAPVERLARFEFEPNQCSFDTPDARELARLQYPEEFGYCFVSHVYDLQKSWPSTPDFWSQ